MRLLTFNTLFKGDTGPRLRALGARLERSGFDVVCLQEVATRRNARLLQRVAPSFHHHAYAGSVVLRGGLMLLSRRPLTARFSGYPRTGPLRGEFLMRKGAQIAEIGDWVVVNTHLSANRDDDWSPGNRWSRVQRAELDHLAGLVAAVGADRPLVVAGDLNVPRDSDALAGFLAATGLRDVLAGDTRPTYRPTPRWPAPPALDHVLVRAPGARADLVFTDDVVPLGGGRTAYLSDHYGISADLGGA